MGTIAARDCLRVLQLTEQVVAAVLMAAVQGMNLRINNKEIDQATLTQGVLDTMDFTNQRFDFLDEDRPLESTLREMTAQIQEQSLQLYE